MQLEGRIVARSPYTWLACKDHRLESSDSEPRANAYVARGGAWGLSRLRWKQRVQQVDAREIECWASQLTLKNRWVRGPGVTLWEILDWLDQRKWIQLSTSIGISQLSRKAERDIQQTFGCHRITRHQCQLSNLSKLRRSARLWQEVGGRFSISVDFPAISRALKLALREGLAPGVEHWFAKIECCLEVWFGEILIVGQARFKQWQSRWCWSSCSKDAKSSRHALLVQAVD